jgi:protein-disulfide isomerase
MDRIYSWLTRTMQPQAWSRLSKKWLGMVVLCLCLWSCSNPVQAENVDPKLKEQVLQIIRENPQVILESVQAYEKEQQQAREEKLKAFLNDLKTKPDQVIGQSPVQGDRKNQILLVEFSDFQCPFCAKAHAALEEVRQKNPNRFSLVFKHYPLTSIHDNAMPAAQAAWAAGQQGKFWQFHDALFSSQKQLGEALYAQIAESLKLDLQKFNRDRASGAAAAAVNQDVALGEKIGINSTPTFFVSAEGIAIPIQFPDLINLLEKGSP